MYFFSAASQYFLQQGSNSNQDQIPRPPIETLKRALVGRDPKARQDMVNWMRVNTPGLHFLPPEIFFPPHVVDNEMRRATNKRAYPSTEHAVFAHSVIMANRYLWQVYVLQYIENTVMEIPSHMSIMLHLMMRYTLEELVWRMDQSISAQTLFGVYKSVTSLVDYIVGNTSNSNAIVSWKQTKFTPDEQQLAQHATRHHRKSQAAAATQPQNLFISMTNNVELLSAEYLANFDKFLMKLLRFVSNYPERCDTTANLVNVTDMAIATMPEDHMNIVKGFYRAIKPVANQFVKYCGLMAQCASADQIYANAEIAARDAGQPPPDPASVLISSDYSYAMMMTHIQEQLKKLMSPEIMVAKVQQRLPVTIRAIGLDKKMALIESRINAINEEMLKSPTTFTTPEEAEEFDQRMTENIAFIRDRQTLMSLLKNTMLACTKTYHFHFCDELRLAPKMFGLVSNGLTNEKAVHNDIMSKVKDLESMVSELTSDGNLQKSPIDHVYFQGGSHD